MIGYNREGEANQQVDPTASVYGLHASIATEVAIVFFSLTKKIDRWYCKIFHYCFLSNLLITQDLSTSVANILCY